MTPDHNVSRWQRGEMESITGAELGRPHIRRKNPIVQGYLEGVTQPLYDWYGVAASTVVPKLILFSVPQGQIYNFGGIASFAKTELYTNMVQNAVLPAPNKFIVRAISVFVQNDVNPTDLYLFLATVLLQFSVNVKLYCEQQVGRFPAGGGSYGVPAGFAASTGTATYSGIGNGWPDTRNTYTQAYGGVPIEQQQTFAVVVDPGLNRAGPFTTQSVTQSATNPVIGTGIQATVYLDGTLFRAVQ